MLWKNVPICWTNATLLKRNIVCRISASEEETENQRHLPLKGAIEQHHHKIIEREPISIRMLRCLLLKSYNNEINFLFILKCMFSKVNQNIITLCSANKLRSSRLLQRTMCIIESRCSPQDLHRSKKNITPFISTRRHLLCWHFEKKSQYYR